MNAWQHVWDDTVAGWGVWVMQRAGEIVATAQAQDPYRFRQADMTVFSRPWVESWVAALNRVSAT